MFAVVKYYNYNTDQTFEVLHVTTNLDYAEKLVLQRAKEYYEPKNEKIKFHVINKYFYLKQALVELTTGDGYDKYVFAIIQMPFEKTDINI